MSNSNQLMHATIDAEIARATREAVNSDRQRSIAKIQAMIEAAVQRGEPGNVLSYHDCLEAIRLQKLKPPPPAEETLGPTSTKVERLLATARHKAVKTERARAKAVARNTVLTGFPFGQVGAYIAEQIERTASEPEPPPKEPMTIPRLIEKLTSYNPNDWIRQVTKDLEALVKEQANRDAEIACRGGYIGEDTGR